MDGDDRPPEYVPSNHSFKGKVSKRPSRSLLVVAAIFVVALVILGVVVSGVLAPAAGTNNETSKATISVTTTSSITAGERLSISWICSDRDEVGDTVSIFYSPVNEWPNTRTLLTSTANDGYQTWTVPGTLKGKYVVYVTSSDGAIVGHGGTLSILASSSPNPIDPWVPPDVIDEPRVEPVVSLSWNSPPPAQSATPASARYWSFGETMTVVLRNSVQVSADSAKIANVITFPNLDASEVSVTANTGSGSPLAVNLFDDGKGGSYGLLIDSAANIQGEKAWTWQYSSLRSSYDVSFNIVFYELGQQSFTLAAYDQDTGKQVDAGKLVTPARVWGRGLAGPGTGIGSWSGVLNPAATGPLHNYTLYDSMSSMAQSHYSGTLKDVVSFEGVSVRVWGVIDGSPVLWNPTADGKYEFYWENFYGASSHEFRIQVQFLTSIPPGGTAVMHYGVFDNSSGENLLAYSGSAYDDIRMYLYP